jgi:predicted nucleic acid-binding protein
MLASKRGLVPALWHLQIANGLAMAERRGDLSRADVEDALNQILATAASKLDTETNLVSARDALANARSFPLTAYDAVYLGLARREGLPLATLDKSLRAAAAKAGVALLK